MKNGEAARRQEASTWTARKSRVHAFLSHHRSREMGTISSENIHAP
jgi:hypothetical protein